MKKFLVVLLSLGLIVAFGTAASAADVKFGGSYYVAGYYDNNPALADKDNVSQSAIYQQVRITPVFTIAEGLKFTMRADLLEKGWGDVRWKTGTMDSNSARLQNTAAAVAIDENIQVEQSYVTFNTKVGVFQVGYQSTNAWGTSYGNNTTTAPQIAFMTQFGNFTMGVAWEKWYDSITQLANNTTYPYHEQDYDVYDLMGTYKAKGMEAGLLYRVYANNAARYGNGGSYQLMQQVSPYAKMTFGPVYVEGEFNYMFGKALDIEAAGGKDVDAKAWSAYLNGNVTFGPAKVGLLWACTTGDDKGADNSRGLLPGGYTWNPALILMNSDLKWWGGSGHSKTNHQQYIWGKFGQSNGLSDSKYNTIFYQLYGSYNVTPKLTLNAALTYATVQTKKLTATTEAFDDKLGTEFDLSATYKIFDNLSYMVGAGYLWAGDYFKGVNNPANTTVVDNNYVIMNKLTLNF